MSLSRRYADRQHTSDRVPFIDSELDRGQMDSTTRNHEPQHSPAFEEAILPMELPNWHTRRALLASALGRMRALVFPV